MKIGNVELKAFDVKDKNKKAKLKRLVGKSGIVVFSGLFGHIYACRTSQLDKYLASITFDNKVKGRFGNGVTKIPWNCLTIDYYIVPNPQVDLRDLQNFFSREITKMKKANIIKPRGIV